MATGATGTPTSNFSIPKYSTSADAPNGTGFNSAMDAIDLALKGIDDAKLEVTGTPTNGQVPVSDGAGGVAWTTLATAAATNRVLLNTPDASGNAFPNTGALTDWVAAYWEFAKDVDASVYGTVLVPSGVTSATLRLLIAANATSGVTRLNIATSPVANGETINPGALTDGTAQDITVPGTAYFRKDVTFSLTGLAGADLLLLQILHNGAHANDTLAVSTLLLGAWLEAA